MKLSEFINKDSIFLDVRAESQKNVFKILGNIFSKKNKTLSSLIIDKLNERERLGSTSVGNGIAIPHTKIDGINETQVIFLKLKDGVDFSASDGKKIKTSLDDLSLITGQKAVMTKFKKSWKFF